MLWRWHGGGGGGSDSDCDSGAGAGGAHGTGGDQRLVSRKDPWIHESDSHQHLGQSPQLLLASPFLQSPFVIPFHVSRQRRCCCDAHPRNRWPPLKSSFLSTPSSASGHACMHAFMRVCVRGAVSGLAILHCKHAGVAESANAHVRACTHLCMRIHVLAVLLLAARGTMPCHGIGPTEDALTQRCTALGGHPTDGCMHAHEHCLPATPIPWRWLYRGHVPRMRAGGVGGNLSHHHQWLQPLPAHCLQLQQHCCWGCCTLAAGSTSARDGADHQRPAGQRWHDGAAGQDGPPMQACIGACELLLLI